LKKSFQILKAYTKDQNKIEKVIPDLEVLLQVIKFKSKKFIPDLKLLLQSIKLNLKKSFQILKYFYKWSNVYLKSHSRSWSSFTNDLNEIQKVIPDLEVLLQMIKCLFQKSFQILKYFYNRSNLYLKKSFQILKYFYKWSNVY